MVSAVSGAVSGDASGGGAGRLHARSTGDRIDAESRQTRHAWALAGLWNLLVLPLLVGCPMLFERDGLAPGPFVLPFALLGGVLALRAARETLRATRFGVAQLEPEVWPCVLGGSLIARLHVAETLRQAESVDVRVVCLEAGAARRDPEVTLWSRSAHLPISAAEIGPRGLVLPLRLPLPFDAPPSCAHARERAGVRWRVEVDARMPGLDYAARFVVPVMRAPGGDPAQTRAALARGTDGGASASARCGVGSCGSPGDRRLASARVRPDAPDARAARGSPQRVRVWSPASTGVASARREVVLDFPPQRRVGMSLFALASAALFGLLAWAALTVGGQRVFALLFVATTGALVFSALRLWTLRVRVRARSEGLDIERRMLGLSWRVRVARERIARVLVESSPSGYWGLRVDPAPGHAPGLGVWRVPGGGLLRDRLPAEQLAAHVSLALGLEPS